MKKMTGPVLLAGCLLFLAGCNTLAGQPGLQGAAITPDTLKPGEGAVVTMGIRDRQGIIDRVQGVVVEDPRITFRLLDDGQDPDVKAGDGVWSMGVDVPFQAPPGEYFLEMTAYTDDGEPVTIREKGGTLKPLQAVVPLRILPSEN